MLMAYRVIRDMIDVNKMLDKSRGEDPITILLLPLSD